MRRGLIIIADGCEGSGKTTCVERAGKEFSKDILCTTREPGGTPFAERIREAIMHPATDDNPVPHAQYFAMWAARAQLLHKIIIPTVDRGVNILIDRFDASTWAYQIVGNAQPELIPHFHLTRSTILGEYLPDHYFFFDVEPEEGLARRARARNLEETMFDKKTIDYHQLVQGGYREFFDERYDVTAIDANRPEDVVQAEFLRQLHGVLDK